MEKTRNRTLHNVYFPLPEILKKGKTIVTDSSSRSVFARGWDGNRGLTEKNTREFFGIMKFFHSMAVLQLYTFAKSHQNVHLKMGECY